MPILINEDLCVKGCTLCDQFCPGDIIYRLDAEKIPEIRYEDECWYCGSCEQYCPTGAVKIVFPPEMLQSQIPAVSLFGKTEEESSASSMGKTKGQTGVPKA
jgi:NAD-dependent dihydropyrimidine dehydrogenase PreA subunit